MCVPEGTYQFTITDRDGRGMGDDGSYTGYFKGGQIFSSDPADRRWQQQQHTFCYGPCSSTSPSLSPSVSPSKGTVELPSDGIAIYDNVLRVPKCSGTSPSCRADEIYGKGSVGPEPNAPNSLDNCSDSNAGNYGISESIQSITVSSDTQDDMKEGNSVTVAAKVHCWYTGKNDFADFYYTNNVADPEWIYIGSRECPGGGVKDLSVNYLLPKGSEQAIRVNFSYRVGNRNESSSCVESTEGNEYYNDVDDLVFTVVENTDFQETLI